MRIIVEFLVSEVVLDVWPEDTMSAIKEQVCLALVSVPALSRLHTGDIV